MQPHVDKFLPCMILCLKGCLHIVSKCFHLKRVMKSFRHFSIFQPNLWGDLRFFIANTWKIKTSEDSEVYMYAIHTEPPSDFHTNVTSRDSGTHIPLLLGSKYLDES